MIKRTTASENAPDHTPPVFGAWHRPPVTRVTGWALLCGATMLLLAGAHRTQSNMITSGLLFLALGVLFAPEVLQRGLALRLAVAALAGLGAVYTFLV